MADRGARRGWLAAALAAGVLLTACAAPASPASSAASATGSLHTSPGSASSSVDGETTAPTSLGLSLPAEVTATVSTSANGSAGGTTAPALPDCTAGGLPTVTAGTLTIGTDSPAQSPWFVGDDPSSGAGLESAVAYAVAGVLGYGREQVDWKKVGRAQAAAGGAGGFDLDLNQFTAPDALQGTADYSTGYFSVTEALVTGPGSTPRAGSVAALGGLRLAAPAGSSAADTVQRLTGSSAMSFPDAAQALGALANGSVDGVVLPIQAAIAVTAANPGLTLVGQLPSDPEIQPEQFKVLLPAGSELTGCVSTAIDKLRVEGTLHALADQWVVPVAPQLS